MEFRGSRKDEKKTRTKDSQSRSLVSTSSTSSSGNSGNRKLLATRPPPVGLWTTLNSLDKNTKMFTNLASYITKMFPVFEFDLETEINRYITYDRYECILLSILRLHYYQPTHINEELIESLFQLRSTVTRNPLRKLVESDNSKKRTRKKSLKGLLQICGFFQCSTGSASDNWEVL